MNQLKNPRESFTHVYYHQSWIPSLNGSLIRLINDGSPVSIQEYRIEIGDSRQYFCPRCGYPCYRTPRNGEPARDGRLPDFRHFKASPIRPCNYRTGQSQGQIFENENEREQALEDGRLIEVSEWLQYPEGSEGSGGQTGTYSGVHEDPEGIYSPSSINRYWGNEVSVDRTICSLQYICYQIDQFLHQDIRLPDRNTHEPFRNIFIHSSEVYSDLQSQQFIYWGVVERICYIQDLLCVCFGYSNHCLYLAIPQRFVDRRHWNEDDLLNQFIAVAGVLELTPRFQAMEDLTEKPRDCWKVIAECWGAFGRIDNRFTEILSPPTEEWIEPPLTAQESSSQGDSAEYVNPEPLIEEGNIVDPEFSIDNEQSIHQDHSEIEDQEETPALQENENISPQYIESPAQDPIEVSPSQAELNTTPIGQTTQNHPRRSQTSIRDRLGKRVDDFWRRITGR